MTIKNIYFRLWSEGKQIAIYKTFEKAENSISKHLISGKMKFSDNYCIEQVIVKG